MGPVRPVKNINMQMNHKEYVFQTIVSQLIKYSLLMEHVKLVRTILMPMMNKYHARLIHARVLARFYN